jgi:hypothetical protein
MILKKKEKQMDITHLYPYDRTFEYEKDKTKKDFLKDIKDRINIVIKKRSATWAQGGLNIPHMVAILKTDKLPRQELIDKLMTKPLKSKDRTIDMRTIIVGKQDTINMEKLKTVYNKGFGFPDWAIAAVQKNDLMQKAKVYYDKGDDLNNVKLTNKQREPVCMGMSGYDNTALQREFGWSESFYKTYYKTNGILAPNIAIYTPTTTESGKKIHIFNSVVYLFTKTEPDYKYFTSLEPQERIKQLKKRYRAVFKKIFHCAEENGLSIVMPTIGTSDYCMADYQWDNTTLRGFQTKYTDVSYVDGFLDEYKLQAFHTYEFHKHVWLPAFSKVREEYPEINVKLADLSSLDKPTFDIEETLYVTECGPSNLPGNGHEKDGTLGGYFGKQTSIAVTGSLMTNPWIDFVEIS